MGLWVGGKIIQIGTLDFTIRVRPRWESKYFSEGVVPYNTPIFLPTNPQPLNGEKRSRFR